MQSEFDAIFLSLILASENIQYAVSLDSSSAIASPQSTHRAEPDSFLYN